MRNKTLLPLYFAHSCSGVTLLPKWFVGFTGRLDVVLKSSAESKFNLSKWLFTVERGNLGLPFFFLFDFC